MKSLPLFIACASLLSLTSCKTGEAQQFRLMLAQANAEDDFGDLEFLDIDRAGGVEIQVMGALTEADDTLYGVGGFGYQTVDNSLVDGGDAIDVEATRISFHGGVEKQFIFNEAARFLLQGGIMYNDIEIEGTITSLGDVLSFSDSENAIGLYVALGLQVQFNDGLAGTLMYRPLEPSVDFGLAGDIDTETLLLGITLLR